MTLVVLQWKFSIQLIRDPQGVNYSLGWTLASSVDVKEVHAKALTSEI